MTNFTMDETAMKIKAIIEPYEKKITELENIIKQKDFEILVLNEKLNNLKNNQMNQFNNQIIFNNQINMNNNINMMNANWMDQYNNMQNSNNMNLNLNSINNNQNNINEYQKTIDIFFRGKKTHMESCYPDEKTEIVCRRVCKKLGIKFKNHKFFIGSGGKNIANKLSVTENGITNNTNIFVIERNSKKSNDEGNDSDDSNGVCQCEDKKINITFKTTLGETYNISISQEHSMSTLLKHYLIKTHQKDRIIQIKEGKKDIAFLFNSKKIQFNDKTKIKDFFKNFICPKVVVNDINNLTLA